MNDKRIERMKEKAENGGRKITEDTENREGD